MLMAVLLCACESQQDAKMTEQREPITQQEYEQDKARIDTFCKLMHVDKEDISIYHNFSENQAIQNYDIVAEEAPDVSGTYMLLSNAAYKKVTLQERKQWNLTAEDNYTMDEIYYPVYENGVLADSENASDTQSQTLAIDEEKLSAYDEKRYSATEISGVHRGYMNKDDRFSVDFVSDNSERVRGFFLDGKWNIEKKANRNFEDVDIWKRGADDTLWGASYSDMGRLIVVDLSGKIRYELNLKKWQEANGYANATFSEIVPLAEGKCILVFEENEKKKSCQLDLETKTIIEEYDFALDGVQSGDYIYQLVDNQLNVYNYKDASKVASLNVKNLREEHFHDKLVYYDKSAKEFLSIGDNPYTNMEISANENSVYISSFVGVFEWTVGEEKIYKIMDGKNTKYFNRMNGQLEVGRDGSIYMLGNLGRQADDGQIGSSDFLVLTKKDKEEN